MKGLWKNTWKHKWLVLMALPTVVILFMFHYMPMFGLVLAFREHRFGMTIFEWPWVGFDNFRVLFTVPETMWRLIRNTVGYWALFLITGTFFNVVFAILLDECRLKFFKKAAHTVAIFPIFISWIAVSFIVHALLNENFGMINSMLTRFGFETISWYISPRYWPAILLIVNLWRHVGFGSIIYLSALSGIDPEMYESARVDGAGRWRQIRSITLPMLVPLICIMTLLSLGSIMVSNTGLFYQVTRNVGSLWPTTQTIDAYVLNALRTRTDFGRTAAVTLFQSGIGLFMVLFANLVVRRWNPDHALF